MKSVEHFRNCTQARVSGGHVQVSLYTLRDVTAFARTAVGIDAAHLDSSNRDSFLEWIDLRRTAAAGDQQAMDTVGHQSDSDAGRAL